MRHSNFWLIIFVFLFCSCKQDFSPGVRRILKLAGENRQELKKVLDHYQQNKADSLKLRAARFLIENMPGHFSYDSSMLKVYRPMLIVYDSLIRYREKHPELNLIKRMDSLWKHTLQAHNLYADVYSRPLQEDIKSVSSDYLIRNIDEAFEAWQNNPYADSIPFSDFCEYILPYRKQQGLCLEEWRSQFFNDNFHYTKKKYPLPIQRLADSLLFRYTNFSHTYQIMPNYPYLKLADFKISKRGGCGEKCWFNSMLFASLGIPVAIDFIPAWGNRNDKHQWNVLIYNGKNYPFESFWEENKWKYKELYNNKSSDPLYGDFRLAKVYRYCYRTNNEGPASDPQMSFADIPPLFLNTKKTDVSDKYFLTCDVEVFLRNKPPSARYVYLCVFSADHIVPVQWGEITAGNKAVFKNMGKDIIYVPAYYKEGVLIPAGQAFHLNYNGQKEYFHPKHRPQMIILRRKYPVFPVKMKWLETLVGGKFQGANNLNFHDAVDLYTIEELPDFILKTVNINDPKTYRYARFLFAKEKYGNLAEIKFYTSAGNCLETLKGNQIQADKLLPDIMSRALDGNISTFILPYMPGLIGTSEYQWWVGLDFGVSKSISAIGFCPRTDENNIFPGLNYELRYWGNGWISLGIQKAEANEITYSGVPTDALFILRCLDKGKEERIFTYENGQQVWH